MLAPAGEWLRSVAERRLVRNIDDHDGIDHHDHDDHDDFFTRIVDQSLSDYILIGLCATGNYRHKSNRDIDDPTLEIIDFYKACLTRLLYDVVNDIDADDDVIDCDKVWSTYLSTLSTFPTTGLSARDS